MHWYWWLLIAYGAVGIPFSVWWTFFDQRFQDTDGPLDVAISLVLSAVLWFVPVSFIIRHGVRKTREVARTHRRH